MNDFQLAALKKRIGTVRTPITDSELLSLIARMEAAEEYIRVNVCDKDTTSEMLDAWEAWRKSSGKSESERK